MLTIAKWAWVILVLGGAVYFFISHFKETLSYLRLVSVVNLVISLIFLVVGRILQTQLAKAALQGQSFRPPFTRMLHIFSMTQLAKYLPGGLWQFVARFGVYQANGMTPVQSGRVMLVENLWLVLSAGFFGAMSGFQFLLNWMKIPSGMSSLVGWIGLILAAWFATLWLIDRYAGLQRHSLSWFLIYLIPLQIANWFINGLSFWILLPSNEHPLSLIWVSISAFCISYVFGFIAIWAPSGIGVREVVLSYLMGIYISPQAAIIYGTLNRIIWVFTDMMLGLFCELFYGTGKLASIVKMKEPSR